jgi:hypothetical protein
MQHKLEYNFLSKNVVTFSVTTYLMLKRKLLIILTVKQLYVRGTLIYQQRINVLGKKREHRIQ